MKQGTKLGLRPEKAQQTNLSYGTWDTILEAWHIISKACDKRNYKMQTKVNQDEIKITVLRTCWSFTACQAWEAGRRGVHGILECGDVWSQTSHKLTRVLAERIRLSALHPNPAALWLPWLWFSSSEMRPLVRSVVLKLKSPAIWKCYYARIQPQTTKGEFPDVRIPRQHFLKAPLMYSQGGKLTMPCEFLLHSGQTSDSEMPMRVGWRAYENGW